MTAPVSAPALVGPITQITAQADDSLHKWNGVCDYVITSTGARVTSFQHSYIETFNPAYGGNPGDGENSCRIKRCPPGADPEVAANWAVVADLDKLRSGGNACSDTNVTVLSSWRGQSNVLFCNYTAVSPVLSGESAMYAWNRYSISTDDGATWSAPADLSDLIGFPQPGKYVVDGGYYELCASRPLITSDGTIVMTTYNRTTTNWLDWDFQARCYRSTDDGYTWSGPISIMPYIYGYRFDEPYTVELADGSLLCTSRVTEDTHATPYANTVMTIWASKSADDGVTWSAPLRVLGPGAQTPAGGYPTKWGLGNRPCVTVINGVAIMVMRSMYSTDGVTLARASGDCFAASVDGLEWTEWYDVRTGALYNFSVYQNASFHGRFQPAPSGSNLEVLFSQYETDPYIYQPNWVQVYRNVFSGMAPIGVAGLGNTVSSGYGDATAQPAVTAGITIDPASNAWEQVDTQITVRVLADNPDPVQATILSGAGGLVRFRGTDAALFEIRETPSDPWTATLDVAAGETPVYLRVNPVAPGTTLEAQIGIPS